MISKDEPKQTLKERIEGLRVGESMTMQDVNPPSVRDAAGKITTRSGRKFTTRKLTERSVYIGRIA